MIIFRYLAREVMITMLAVSSVLLLITMSGRFVKYLAEAAAGRLSPDALFAVMGYRLPGFMELVIPLGLFIGILLAYGRLYMQSEMTVLAACGFSQRRLAWYTMSPAILVALFVAALSLLISPMGLHQAEQILNQQKMNSEFEGLSAGRFNPLRSGKGVTYSESFSADRKQMQQVFIAGRINQRDNGIAVVKSATGHLYDHPDYQQRYLVLENGHRYEGQPGQAEYRVTKFEQQAQYVKRGDPNELRPRKSDSKTTAQLFRSDALDDIAALHWRFSLPVLVLVISLMAVPLSKTNPRHGRYVKMIPAILLYIIYLVSLNAARGAVEAGRVSPWLGIWGVHLSFASLALLLMLWDGLVKKISHHSSKRQGGDYAQVK